MTRLQVTVALIAVMLVATSSRPPAAAPDWSAPVNLGAFINSASDDDGPAIAADRLSLYFNSTRPGGAGGQDIYVAQRADEESPWGSPVNLAMVNTPANEFAPAFSFDERHMFFAANRPGGKGGLDIWVSFREDRDDDFGWQEPVNLGVVNTVANEAGPGWLREGPDEILYLTSNRPGGAGGADIYASVRQEDGSFGVPVAVAALNSPVQDARAAVRPNSRELFLFTARAGSVGATDLWTSTRGNWMVPWVTPMNLGPTVNSSSDDMQPAISRDGRLLFFASNRPGGIGLLDLYVSTRTAED